MPTMDEFGDWTERLWRQPFPAKVTAKTNMNGVWYYTWTEQSLAASTGAYEDALGARTGDATDAWAREMNNREVATNTIVMMRFRGMAASGGGPTFEFMAPDDSVTNTTTNTTYTNTTVTYTNTTVNYNTNSVVNVTNTSTYNFQAGSTIIFGGPTVNMTANTSVTLSSTTVLTVTGGAKVVMETPLEVCGYMFWCYQTEDPWNASQNDWDGPSTVGFEGVVFRISASTAISLTGMVPEADGQVVCLTNVGGSTITIEQEHTDSAAANRFYLYGGYDVILPQYGSAVFWYDAVDTRWKCLGISGVQDASTSVRGVINTGAQEFSGFKTFRHVDTGGLGVYYSSLGGDPDILFYDRDSGDYYGAIQGDYDGTNGEFLVVKTYDNSDSKDFQIIMYQGTGTQPTPTLLLQSNSTNYPTIKIEKSGTAVSTGSTGTFLGLQFISGLLVDGDSVVNTTPRFVTGYKYEMGP